MEYLLTSPSGDVTITPKVINTVSEDQHSVIATGVFPASSSIQTHTFTLTLRFRETAVNQDEQQGKNFNGIVTILTEKETEMLYYSNDYPNGTPSDWLMACNDESTRLNCMILADNTGTKYKGTVTSDTLFEHVSPSDGTEDGLWLENRQNKTENDKPVYFFRGNVTNNKVIFAGKYWRIVRINEDGSVRLILGGNTTTDGYAYDGAIQLTTTYSYNNLDGRNSYVGYMYGSSCESGNSYEDCHANINKSGLMISNEAWWTNNLSNSIYNSKISNEAIYCNDRKVYIEDLSLGNTFDGNGTYNAKTMYGTAHRLYVNKAPQFMCPQDNDKFTGTNVNNTGNQELSDKSIGFLTADEYVYAGGLMQTNNQYNYLYQNVQDAPNSPLWWLGSPYVFGGSNAFLCDVVSGSIASGVISNYPIHLDSLGFRPVISLKADTLITSGSDATAYNVD